MSNRQSNNAVYMGPNKGKISGRSIGQNANGMDVLRVGYGRRMVAFPMFIMMAGKLPVHDARPC
jgi:hypothetical protein